jgi:hypothetical protein
VCADPLANPDNACGACMLEALAADCGAIAAGCANDITKGDCMTCSEFMTACDDGCPSLDVLCAPSRQWIADLNACLCGACSDADNPVATPGFMQCEAEPLASTVCTELDHAACVTTPGCHAIDGDPCPGSLDCSASPKFSACVAVAATPVSGACDSLDAPSCETRDDCTSIRLPGPELCCVPHVTQRPFAACVDERQPPSEPVSCGQHTEFGDCLAADGCQPGIVLQSGLAICGPFLGAPHETEGWSVDWIGICLPEW